MTRAWLAFGLLLIGGVASAGPDRSTGPGVPAAHDERPVAAPAPPPDGVGAHSRPGFADRRSIISLLDVRVEGLSADVRDSFRSELEQHIDNKRFWLANRGYMKSRMLGSTRWTEGCLVGPCLAELRAHTGAELVLLAALTGSGTSFGYVITLIRSDTGNVVDQASDRCDVCTVSEVIKKATLAMIEVLNDVPDKLPDEAAEQSAKIDRAVGEVKAELAARDRHTTRLGVTLLAVGLAGAITGGALYMLDDSRPSYALATAAGGLAMAAGSVIVLRF